MKDTRTDAKRGIRPPEGTDVVADMTSDALVSLLGVA